MSTDIHTALAALWLILFGTPTGSVPPLRHSP